MFLEFDLVFYIIFPDFFYFSEFEFQKSVIFKFGHGQSCRISEKIRRFLTLVLHRWHGRVIMVRWAVDLIKCVLSTQH
jgi:hypothetical protein